MLTKFMLVIILQYVHIANHYVVHPKLIQCSMLSILSQFQKRKNCSHHDRGRIKVTVESSVVQGTGHGWDLLDWGIKLESAEISV